MFNIKTTKAHCPIIQKEVVKQLVKGTTESSHDCASFYWNAFLVFMHNGGLNPIPNFKWINCYMYISTFKMSTPRHIWLLIQEF